MHVQINTVAGLQSPLPLSWLPRQVVQATLWMYVLVALPSECVGRSVISTLPQGSSVSSIVWDGGLAALLLAKLVFKWAWQAVMVPSTPPCTVYSVCSHFHVPIQYLHTWCYSGTISYGRLLVHLICTAQIRQNNNFAKVPTIWYVH